MDVLEHALETAAEKRQSMSDEGSLTKTEDLSLDEDDDNADSPVPSGTTIMDPTSGVQYQLRTDSSGSMTYRVVQVSGNASSTVSLPQIGGIQAVLASTFNGNSPPSENGDAKIAYVPTVNSDSAEGALVTTQEGQYFVINSPDLVNSGQRAIIQRSGNALESSRNPGTRDDRRRATHNEVERRRRDKINNWIIRLAKIIPDCQQDHSKQGQSKGGILAKACDYIQELRSTNHRLSDRVKELSRTTVEVETLRQQNEKLKAEVAILRSQSTIITQNRINS